jgi:hypothetical protein
MAMGLVVILLLAADGPKKDATKQDKEKLQGTWKVVSVEVGGKATDDGKGDTWTFKGDEVITKDSGGAEVPRG